MITLQLDIPAYGEIGFNEITVEQPFAKVWKEQHVFDFRSENALPIRRNYSLATNPATDRQLRFNVRIATPPRGQDCLAGVGSAYVHRLRPGDRVTAIGPFGDVPYQARRTRRWFMWAAARAWLRCVPTCRTCLRP